MGLLFKFIINIFALYVVAYLVPGFSFTSIWTTVVAAIVIGIVNTIIKPILQIIALPISIATLGVTALLINFSLLYLCSFIVPGFHIQNFTTAAIASIVLSLVTWFLHRLVHD